LALASIASTFPASSIAVTPSIRTFEYNQVELLDGQMREQFDANHGFFFQTR